MINHILWDVDGTLIDTYPAINYAFSKSLRELGCSVAMNELDALVRESLDHCVKSLSRRFKLEPGLLQRRFAASYAALPLEKQIPFPGVREVCAFIQERGSNVAVTHRSTESTRSLLAIHELAAYFAGIVSVDQGYARKPAPDMFNAALRQYALEPAATLVLGDRELDILAGRAARMTTCLFGQTVLAQQADHQVKDYFQLLEWLRSQE